MRKQRENPFTAGLVPSNGGRISTATSWLSASPGGDANFGAHRSSAFPSVFVFIRVHSWFLFSMDGQDGRDAPKCTEVRKREVTLRKAQEERGGPTPGRVSWGTWLMPWNGSRSEKTS